MDVYFVRTSMLLMGPYRLEEALAFLVHYTGPDVPQLCKASISASSIVACEQSPAAPQLAASGK